MALESAFYTTPNGTKSHYLHTGDEKGQLIICLHGLGGSTETFIPLLPSLPKSYSIALVDFQGFGLSPLNTSGGPISIDGHVSDLSYLIDHLRTTRSNGANSKVIILGHSLGTIVGLHYAAQNPDEVAGLGLFGAGRSAAHIPPARERMRAMATNTREKGIAFSAELATKSNFPSDEQRPVRPEAREAVRQAVGKSDPEGYAQTCEATVDESHKDPDYAKITCPAVFVAGDMDVISPVERSTELSSLLGGDSWVEVVKSGHQPILEDTKLAGAAVTRLLAKFQAR